MENNEQQDKKIEYTDEVNQPVPIFGEEIKKLLDTGDLIDNSHPEVSDVQKAIQQSYEQYMNPPDAELHKRLEDMMSTYVAGIDPVKTEGGGLADIKIGKIGDDVVSYIDRLPAPELIDEMQKVAKYYQYPKTPDECFLKQETTDGYYTSLEEILEDMRQQKRHLTIMSKLHETINKGCYIQCNPTE